MKETLNFIAENILPGVAGVVCLLLLGYAARVLYGKNQMEQARWNRIIKAKEQQEKTRRNTQ